MANITEKIQAVLQQHLKFFSEEQPFPMELELEKMGLDSMSAINLLFDLEEAFEVSFPESMLSAETFRTASTLKNAVQSLVNI